MLNGQKAKIFMRLILVTGVFAFVILMASARGTETGTTFATYGIDLKIDSKSYYNGSLVPSSTWHLKNLVPGSDHFFNLHDIKPGDFGTTTISMHVKKSDAWLCLDFKNLEQEENGVNEPESLVDPTLAYESELADSMEFFAWIDDGDNKYEVGERPLFGTEEQLASSVLNDTTYPIGDTGHGGSCKINQTRYVGIFWCVGNLSVSTSTGATSCDGSLLGNEVQTDSMSVDVSIRALPSKSYPRFLCSSKPDDEHDDDKEDKPKDKPDDWNDDDKIPDKDDDNNWQSQKPSYKFVLNWFKSAWSRRF